MKKILKPHALALVGIFILSLIGTKPLFHSGLYTAHDIWHQVARLYHYSQALGDGQIFPGWISTLAFGYGYPLFFFSYHLPWIFGSVLLWLGMSIPVAIKSLFFLSFLGSGLTFYWLAHIIFKKKLPAFVGAALYLWAPYHFLTLFVSAAMGTSFSFAFLPLIFIGLIKTAREKLPSGFIITALGTAGVVLSHLMTFVFIAPFIVLAVLVLALRNQELKPSYKMLRNIINQAVGLVLGFSLSSFYLLPLASFLPLVRSGELTNTYDHYFATFRQLLYSPWGFGPIISNAKDGEISLQVGLAQWLAVLGLSGMIFLQRKNKSLVKKSVFFLASFSLSIFFMTDASKGVWGFATKFLPADFPFRFLLVSVFFGSLAAVGLLVALKNNLLKTVAAGVLVVLALYSNRNHVRVNLYTDIPVADYVQAETTTSTYNEYLPKTANSSLLKEDPPLTIPEQKSIAGLEQNTNSTNFKITLEEQKELSLRHFVFPGLKIFVNDTPSDFQTDSQGRVKITLPTGTSHISLRYEKPFIVKISLALSALTLVILIWLGITLPLPSRKKE